MTTEEFKKKYPHYAHLEGNKLWDAMVKTWLQEHPQKKEPILYIETLKKDGYTFDMHVTQSMLDFWKPFKEQAERIKEEGLGRPGFFYKGKMFWFDEEKQAFVEEIKSDKDDIS